MFYEVFYGQAALGRYLARIIRCDCLNMRVGGRAGDVGEVSGMEWVAWTQQAASVDLFIVFFFLNNSYYFFFYS